MPSIFNKQLTETTGNIAELTELYEGNNGSEGGTVATGQQIVASIATRPKKARHPLATQRALIQEQVKSCQKSEKLLYAIPRDSSSVSEDMEELARLNMVEQSEELGRLVKVYGELVHTS